jgi:hypothetical protein
VAIPAASSGPPAPDAHGSWSGTPGTVSSASRFGHGWPAAQRWPARHRCRAASRQPAAHGGDAHDRDCGGRAAGGDQRFTDTLNQLRGRDDGDGDRHDIGDLCAARRHALACGGASRRCAGSCRRSWSSRVSLYTRRRAKMLLPGLSCICRFGV